MIFKDNVVGKNNFDKTSDMENAINEKDIALKEFKVKEYKECKDKSKKG